MEYRIAQSRAWDPRASDSGKQGRDHLSEPERRELCRARMLWKEGNNLRLISQG